MGKMAQRKRVFISYSHEDKQLFNALKRYLAPRHASDYLDVWSDERIGTSQNWDQEIQKAIDSAAVAVLLVSQEFLDSDYIWHRELPVLLNAREQGSIELACLYLHISTVDDPDWAVPLPGGRGSVQLTQYQGLNAPDNPVSRLNDHERRELFREAGRKIRELASHMETPAKTEPPMQPVPPKRARSAPEPARDSEDKIHIVTDIPRLLEMIELPGGTFLMGSSASDQKADDDERPQHKVTVSRFALARFPVTRNLYREIVGQAPKEWKDEKDDDLLPANYVPWFEAVQFCNTLSEQQGLRPCYSSQQGLVETIWEWNRSADGYRLPTEAEWEYAVRAGTTTQWFFGDDPAELDHYAWKDTRVHPVGEKKPNPWGFHDLIGNVWELCWDWYGDYSNSPAVDPAGPEDGVGRVVRGGTFWGDPGDLRSANRLWGWPVYQVDFFGFRLVRAARCQP